MNEIDCLNKMVAPNQRRNGVYKGGVIQIWVTRNCDKCCFGCTQGSNLRGGSSDITPEQFGEACKSLQNYFGVVGMFGGNPTTHRHFNELCRIMRKWIPFDRRGLWSNNPLGKGEECRMTFNPSVSNLNVHMDEDAYKEFKEDWPESRPFGLEEDSRHSPVYVAMKDVLKKECPECGGSGGHWNGVGLKRNDWDCSKCRGTGQVYDHETAHELISKCDINQRWSAMVGVFRGELRGWFCEIAGAQSILHQHDADSSGNPIYPDTGIPIPCKKCNGTGRESFNSVRPGLKGYACISCQGKQWWENSMLKFAPQVRKHCHECGVPLRGKGELAQTGLGKEQVSKAHVGIYHSKRTGRDIETVTDLVQIEPQSLDRFTDYLQNARK